MIKNMVPTLLIEADCKPMDMVRAGLSVGVAYRWARDEISRVDFDVVAMLCRLFSERLGRRVDVGDILAYQPDSIHPAAPEPDTAREAPYSGAYTD